MAQTSNLWRTFYFLVFQLIIIKTGIVTLANNISKTVGILNKLRSFLPSGVLQTTYNTLVLPHLIYGILAWDRHTNSVHKIQKRAIRIIASKFNAHSEPLLKACDICKLQELKCYHKLINIQLPKYLECFIHQTNLDLHKYNTRTGHRLHIPILNHPFAQLNTHIASYKQ